MCIRDRLLDMRKQKAAHAQGNDAKGHRRRWMEMYEAIDAGRKDETSANDGNDAAVRYRYEAMEPGAKHHGLSLIHISSLRDCKFFLQEMKRKLNSLTF